MSGEILLLLGIMIAVIAFLLSLLFSPRPVTSSREKDPIRGYCPVCGHDLRKGERVRSNQMQIGASDLRTYIRGCPFCTGAGSRNRSCPVCKKRLQGEESVVAFSNPEADRNRLSIRGCKKCYPQGYDGSPYA